MVQQINKSSSHLPAGSFEYQSNSEADKFWEIAFIMRLSQKEKK